MKIMKLIFLINLIFSTFYIQSAKIFGEIQLDLPEGIEITNIMFWLTKEDKADLQCYPIAKKKDTFEFTDKFGNYEFRLEAEIYNGFCPNKKITKVLLFSCKVELKDDDIEKNIMMNWKQIYEIICNQLSSCLKFLTTFNSLELTEDPEKNKRLTHCEFELLKTTLNQLENYEIFFDKAYWIKEILPHMEISKKILIEYQQFSS